MLNHKVASMPVQLVGTNKFALVDALQMSRDIFNYLNYRFEVVKETTLELPRYVVFVPLVLKEL